MVNEYKNSNIGQVPSSWDVLKFENLFTMLSNNTLSRDNLNYYSGTVKNIHYGDVLILYPEVLDCNRNDIPYVNKNVPVSGPDLMDGDIVIADTAEDETAGKATEILHAQQLNVKAGLHTIACRPQNGVFAPGWLGYYMNSHFYHDQLLPYIHGTKVFSITRKALNSTFIVKPPYEEQEKIVGYLFDIDKCIHQVGEKIKKYQTLKKTCLQHMFPRKGQMEPDIRLPEFTEKWKIDKLGKLMLKGGSGGTPSSSNDEFYGGNIPFLTISDLSGRDIVDTAKTITDEGLINSSAWMVPAGAVSLAMYASVGKVGILMKPMATSQAFYNMIFKDDVLRDFVYYRMVRASACEEWEPYISTGTQRNLNAEKVKSFDILLPVKKEMKYISKFLREIDDIVSMQENKRKKYNMIKQGMIEKLMTGKIRLK